MKMECIGCVKENDMLIFEIRDECLGKINMEEGIIERSYAFYVFYNGKRIITRWYEASKKIEVKALGEGLYYAVGFIKEEDNEPEILESSPIQILQERENHELPPASVSIFGSCVSRDILEYSAACEITLDLYFARQSIISAVADKIPLSYEEIHLQSNFQKKQIFYDYNKNAFEMLQENLSEYLLIDLVDERFPLIKTEGSYVTRSVSLLESGIINGNEPIIEKKEYVDTCGNISYQVEGIDVRVYLDRFCDRILKIYKSQNIILHVVRGAEYYYDENKTIKRFEPNIVGYFKKLNKMWTFMYDYLFQKMNGCIRIDISPGYLADEKHKWGLAPIHFQKEYYERVLEEIGKNIG